MSERRGGRPGHPPRLAGWVAVAALAHAGALGALAAMMVPRLAPPGEAPGVEVVLDGGEAAAGGDAATLDQGVPASDAVAEVRSAKAEAATVEVAAETAEAVVLPAQATAFTETPPEIAAEPQPATVAEAAPDAEAAVTVEKPEAEQPVLAPATVAAPMPVPQPGSADVTEAPPPTAMAWPAPQRPAPPRRAAAVRMEAPTGSAHGAAPGAPSDAAPGRARGEAGAEAGAGDAARDGGAGEADPHEVAAWQVALSTWIARNQTYPQAARHLHTEGVVQVRFVLDAGGKVTSVAVTRASGSEALDAAAVTLLRDAQLPPPPARMSAERRVVTVPIRYRLQ